MESLIKYLEQYDPQPEYSQIANGGNWEEAVRINFGEEDVPGLPILDASVALEIFYKLNDGRAVFFGIRYSDGLNNIHTPHEFLEQARQVLRTTYKPSLRNTLVDLGRYLNNDGRTFTAATVSYVELGVEGYWKSTGSKILHKAGEPKLDIKSLADLLRGNQSLITNIKNHTALEFAVSEPECWIGVQVSKKSNELFKTDMQKLLELVNLI